jgi:hypothetical protein
MSENNPLERHSLRDIDRLRNRSLAGYFIENSIDRLVFLFCILGLYFVGLPIYELSTGSSSWRTAEAVVEYSEPQCLYKFLEPQANGDSNLNAPCNLKRRWVVGEPPKMKSLGPNGKVQLLLSYNHDWQLGKKVEVFVPAEKAAGINVNSILSVRYEVKPPFKIELASWRNSPLLGYAISSIFGLTFLASYFLFGSTWKKWLRNKLLQVHPNSIA